MRLLGKIFFRLALPLAGLPRLLRWLRSSGLVGRWLSRVRPGRDDSCLERSFLEIPRLTRTGRKARLAIGVRKEGGRLLAHAWVESEGETPRDRDGFQRLGSL